MMPLNTLCFNASSTFKDECSPPTNSAHSFVISPRMRPTHIKAPHSSSYTWCGISVDILSQENVLVKVLRHDSLNLMAKYR